jgi:hypothetical protein
MTLAAEVKVSRRNFLKMLGAAGSYAAILPLGMEQLVPPAADSWVEIPPSLMLHSPDGKADFLPPLLERLHSLGFTTTTYKGWYQGVLANNPVPNPVILSIDDITLVRSGPSTFNNFVQMKDWIKAAGGTAVYGVITTPVINGQPQREQDEARWDMMQAWVEEGFELATHTSYHSNFNALDTGPRPDFSAVDYEAEIVQSAELIETKLAERQIDYRVETLILPYGSGYSYQLPEQAIHPGIVNACRQTHIKFVVGIPHGREPLQQDTFENGRKVVYVGRIPPAYLTDLDGRRNPDAAQTAAWLQSW